MQEFELKVGTRFFYKFFDKGLKEITVIESKSKTRCYKCIFKKYNGACLSLRCGVTGREDGKCVRFEEVKE